MVDPEDLARAQRSQRSRSNTRHGDQAQEMVGRVLRQLGLLLVRRIETGWSPIRTFDVRTKRTHIVSARPLARVDADWSAVCPGGRSVRCEVKLRRDDQLSLVDFERHQADALTAHCAIGGLSLVGHVHGQGVSILQWPIAGLELRHPLTVGDERHTAALWKGLGDG